MSVDSTDQTQRKILKALDAHSVTLRDLIYITGLPLTTLRTEVANLRLKGYIDLLSAPLLYWILPKLNPLRNRQTPIDDEEFLSLTASGYLYLHPLIRLAIR